MHPSLKDLHALQQIDTRILQLKREQAALDDGSALSKELESVRASHAKASASLRTAKSELQDAELSLKTLETKKKTYERRLHSGEMTNFKEIASLENELNLLGETKDQFEDKILTLMEQIDTATSEAEALQKKVDSLENKLTDLQAAYKTKKAELDTKIAEEIAQRPPVAAKADPIALKRYEDIRARSGVGLAEVEENSCTGCHTTLTSFSMREAKESVKLVTCENCNRILYLPEEE